MKIEVAKKVLQEQLDSAFLVKDIDHAISVVLIALNEKKYTKQQYLYAAKLGEVSMIDALHVTSLLDEAVIYENK